MMSFQEYIKSIGFIPDRDNDDSFSTMIQKGTIVRYYKGSRKIEWGLNEKDKPPTLIYPRPKETFDSNTGHTSDDLMNRMLSEKAPEEIFKLLEW